MLRPLLAAAVTLAAALPALAQGTPATLFNHGAGRWYLAGQANYIYQEHGGFPALYSGPNSLINTPEDALSRVLTVYTGYQLRPSIEALFDVEETGGQGLSTVLGLAGFTNLDAVRNPTLSTVPYVARLMLHAVINLGGGEEDAAPGALSTFAKLPRRRLELRVGKFGIADFFDLNSVGSDSHLQFMNWTVDNNGAYDYAADTRGYTVGALAELHLPSWSLRFAEALMPKVANGIDLQWDLDRGHSENLELELRRLGGTLRILGYGNTANMGVYRDAIHQFQAGLTPTPEITDHPFRPTRKYGVGLNAEHPLASGINAFVRAGWADGRYESFAYTEVEQTVSGGITLAGGRWGRAQDKLGLATALNGISGDHRRYLALGGLGFLLGDGALAYGREKIVEAFYNLALVRGIAIAPDLQFVDDPGYNRARGPVWVTSARLHFDF